MLREKPNLRELWDRWPVLAIGLLWVALLFTLGASLPHNAWAFSTLESGNMTMGWFQAIAVDLGLLALAISIQDRASRGQKTLWLWIGVVVFAALSGFGNLLHAFSHSQPLDLGAWGDIVGRDLGILNAARPFLLGFSLPILVIYLTEMVTQYMAAVQKENAAREAEIPQREAISSMPLRSLPPSSRRPTTRGEALELILDILQENPTVDVEILAERVGRGKSTVYRYMTQLENEGLVERLEDGTVLVLEGNGDA